ncbi:MAG: hypothetical protein JWN70_1998 [Planctomycetaceae bacterium]|nr:hypothetical protein [Planctomycetaceae bacterium]
MIANQVLPSAPTDATKFESRIADEVLMALRNTGYAQLPDLDIRVDGQDVFLKGRLPSYYLKQKAHFAALAVPGVRTIVDQIDIVG